MKEFFNQKQFRQLHLGVQIDLPFRHHKAMKLVYPLIHEKGDTDKIEVQTGS